jgi:D-sedoheptulose 7-phosphate isomerase
MKTAEEFLKGAVQESLALKEIFFRENLGQIVSFYELLKETAKAGRTVLIFGNGGSAADAQHFAAELMHRVENRKIGVKAIALHTDTSLITALGNDEGFDGVYARQLEVLASAGDLAVAISTTGNSTNIVEGLRAGRKASCKTVGLLGRTGGKAAQLCDLKLVVQHSSTPRIQEVHGMIIHFVCQLLEEQLP